MSASGMTEAELLADFPYLEKADFPAVYGYAAKIGRQALPTDDQGDYKSPAD